MQVGKGYYKVPLPFHIAGYAMDVEEGDIIKTARSFGLHPRFVCSIKKNMFSIKIEYVIVLSWNMSTCFFSVYSHGQVDKKTFWCVLLSSLQLNAFWSFSLWLAFSKASLVT